ncbi:hypothetical protein Q5752_003121 [Cryptotrichosporon argae]
MAGPAQAPPPRQTGAVPTIPVPAPSNPSRPPPRPTGSLRAPPVPMHASGSGSGAQRMGVSPMSFGAPMSGVSFNNQGEGRSYRYGSYGAGFYGGGDSPHLPFGTSINMLESPSFATSASAFNLSGSMMSSSFRRSYAAAARGEYGNLSASMASLTTNPMYSMGSMGRSYSKAHIEAIMAVRSDAELTKEYECCGRKHAGLHALLEHVEDQHPYDQPGESVGMGIRNGAGNAPSGNASRDGASLANPGFSPVTLAMDLDLDDIEPSALARNPLPTPAPSAASARSSTSPRPVPTYAIPKSQAGSAAPSVAASTSPAPLKLSDVLASPPEADAVLSAASGGARTASSTTTAASPTRLVTPAPSAAPSPSFGPQNPMASRGGFAGTSAAALAQSKRFDRAFNEVVAGSSPKNGGAAGQPTAVAPGLLFASAATLGIPTVPPGQAKPEPKPPAASGEATPALKDGAVTSALTGGLGTPPPPPGAVVDKNRALLEPHLPQPSLFTTHKAWRCPNPGCNKAYKQSNGLKYHLQKGQCDFAIHDAIDHGLTLEEAEERSRPYVCAVGAGCTKRYRQMNGLKYHYLNSGEHGEYGLRMLQNGTHPQPPSFPPAPKRDRPANAPGQHAVHGAQGIANTTAAARPAAAPYAVPNRVGGPPRMGTWPAQPRPNGVGAAAGAGAGTQAHHVNGAVPAPAGIAAGRPLQTHGHTPQPHALPKAAQAQAQAAPTPIQRGRDAVLFSALGPLEM